MFIKIGRYVINQRHIKAVKRSALTEFDKQAADVFIITSTESSLNIDDCYRFTAEEWDNRKEVSLLDKEII